MYRRLVTPLKRAANMLATHFERIQWRRNPTDRIGLYFIILCVFFSGVTAHGGVAGNYNPLLTGIEFARLSETSERVSMVLNGYYPPVISTTGGDTPRVLCDFYDMSIIGDVPRSYETGGTMITRVRIGTYTSPEVRVRVVLDLSPDRDYVVKQVFSQNDKSYIVIVEQKTKRR